MNCTNCAAPLPTKETICRYCGTRNQVDLRALPHTDKKPGSVDCPHCAVAMDQLTVTLNSPVTIDRCGRCKGLFFDPGELELILDDAVAHVHEADYSRLQVLTEKEGVSPPTSVRYIQCPHCQKHMNRRSFGARSGVVVDSCKDHGIWLDSGELERLLAWMKAGGQLHQLRRQEEREHQEKLAKAMLTKQAQSAKEFNEIITLFDGLL